MGGDVNRENTQTQQRSSGHSITGTPGTAWGTGILNSIDGSDYTSQITNTRPYEGDRIAGPTDLGAGNYVAQWGNTPSTFVPQRTATDAPIQATQTYVAPNYQQGIDEGLAAAGNNTTNLAPNVQNLFDYWGNITGGGGQNPYLEPVIDAFGQDFQEYSDRQRGQRALYAGAEGAFGGTPFQQGETWAGEQEADQFNRTVSGLRYQDFLNTQGLMERAPGQLAEVAGLGTLGADQTLHYGNMQQENLEQAAAVGDYNAQVLLNNLHQAQQLNDTNAIAAAQEEIAQWTAAHQAEEARVADLGAQTATQQEASQADIDNSRLQYEAYQTQISQQMEQLAQLLGLSRIVPGASTSTEGFSSGSSNTTANATEGFGWDDFSGIISAIIGGVSSDKRVKKNLELIRVDHRGVKWYLFHYWWQKDEELQAQGVIAQELQEIAPQFVKNCNGLLVVDYDGLNQWEGELHVAA